MIALGTVATAACTGTTTTAGVSKTTSTTAASTTAGAGASQQLDWLIGASARAPVPAAEIDRHFTTQFLTAIGGPDKINSAFESLGQLTLRQLLITQPAHVEAVLGGPGGQAYEAELATTASGLIDSLGITQYVAAPQTWAALDTQLRALAPQVSYAAMTIDPAGGCRLVHGLSATVARPLGSAFKLYVLGALGHAVADHRASWTEKLAIHEQWKSLPSGVLQNDPAGTELTLQQYADHMISISDNTAADHLIHFLGRDAVQAQLSRFGNQSAARDIPFLTTREMFALKAGPYPVLADKYLSLSTTQRTAELSTLDQIPLSQLHAWTQPEKIDQIEWFASPADICRAYAGLWRQNAQPGLSQIGAALSINDGGIGLDPGQYPVVWFKGGSEPGVLTLNYLARSAGGQLIVSSLMLASPSASFDEAAITAQVLALARGGIQLAGQQSS